MERFHLSNAMFRLLRVPMDAFKLPAGTAKRELLHRHSTSSTSSSLFHSQVRKLRHRQVTHHMQSHTAGERQSLDVALCAGCPH